MEIKGKCIIVLLAQTKTHMALKATIHTDVDVIDVS